MCTCWEFIVPTWNRGGNTALHLITETPFLMSHVRLTVTVWTICVYFRDTMCETLSTSETPVFFWGLSSENGLSVPTKQQAHGCKCAVAVIECVSDSKLWGRKCYSWCCACVFFFCAEVSFSWQCEELFCLGLWAVLSFKLKKNAKQK